MLPQARTLPEAKRCLDQILLWHLQREQGPADTLILDLWPPEQCPRAARCDSQCQRTSELRHCEAAAPLSLPFPPKKVSPLQFQEPTRHALPCTSP